jgi:hypothetical protein
MRKVPFTKNGIYKRRLCTQVSEDDLQGLVKARLAYKSLDLKISAEDKVRVDNIIHVLLKNSNSVA